MTGPAEPAAVRAGHDALAEQVRTDHPDPLVLDVGWDRARSRRTWPTG